MFDNLELSCQFFYNGSQWSVYDFPMLQIGDFFGINTDLRIDPNSIPHTVNALPFCQTSVCYRQKTARFIDECSWYFRCFCGNWFVNAFVQQNVKDFVHKNSNIFLQINLPII